MERLCNLWRGYVIYGEVMFCEYSRTLGRFRGLLGEYVESGQATEVRILEGVMELIESQVKEKKGIRKWNGGPPPTVEPWYGPKDFKGLDYLEY